MESSRDVPRSGPSPPAARFLGATLNMCRHPLVRLLAALVPLTSATVHPQTQARVGGGDCRLPGQVQSLGQGFGAPGAAPRLEVRGAPLAGLPFAFEVCGARPGATGVLILSDSVAAAPAALTSSIALPGPGRSVVGFTVGPEGCTEPLWSLAPVTHSLCGISTVGRAIVAGPPEATTQRVKLRFGHGVAGHLYPGATWRVGRIVDSARGDLDGDGRPDLVLAEEGALVSMLTRGKGNLVQAWSASLPGLPNAVVLGDVNGDGRLDAVVASDRSGRLDTFLGLGEGRFQTPGLSVGLEGGNDLDLADFDLDGNLDVVVAHDLAKQVEVLLGGGDGFFDRVGTFGAGARPQAVLAARLDGDSYPDVAVANAAGISPDKVSVLLGAGDGTLGSRRSYPVGLLPIALAQGDVDGDGRKDLVVANLGSKDLTVLRRNAGGYTNTAQVKLRIDPLTLTTGDVDGDGFLDVVAGGFQIEELVIVGGDGTPTGLAARGRIPLGDHATSLHLAKFTRDDRADLLVTSRGDPSVTLFERGAARFVAPRVYDTGRAPADVVAVDLDGDFANDLVVANASQRVLTVLLGKGDGKFSTTPGHPTARGAERLASGDVNGDGRPDVVAAHNDGAAVEVHLGQGDGTFVSGTPIPVLAEDVAVGDLDGDGAEDLVAVGTTSATALLGAGDGTFSTGGSWPMGNGIWAVALADLDGDGNLDLATANSTDDAVGVRLGVGDGTFGALASYATANFPVALTAGDLDGDGVRDLVVTSSVNVNSFLRGSGDGSFAPFRSSMAGITPLDVAVADVDRDGLLDILNPNQNSNDLTWSRALGDGTFATGRGFLGGQSVSAIAVADFDRDLLPDVALVSPVNDTVIVSTNQVLRGDR